MKYRGAALAIYVLGSSAPHIAEASTFAYQSIETLVRDSHAIVRLTITDRVSYAAHGRIFTRLQGKIHETLSGSPPTGTLIEIVTLGGRHQGIVQAVSGSTANLANNTMIVAPLMRQLDGSYVIRGMGSAAFIVDAAEHRVARMVDVAPAGPGRTTPITTLADLKRAIAEASHAR